MKISNFDYYKPVEIALKGMGLKIDEFTKKDKKTVIIVSPYKEGSGSRITSENNGKTGNGK